MPFEQAVVEGAKIFGCHPYLTEEDYLQKLRNGRIRAEDIEAVLIEDLGDRGDELLGMLGTRFHLRMSMLCHPLPTGPAAELKWLMAETEAVRRFRDDVAPANKRGLIDTTKRWVMLELRNGVVTSPANEESVGFHKALGFEVERVAHDYDGPGEDRVLFVKSLG